MNNNNNYDPFIPPEPVFVADRHHLDNFDPRAAGDSPGMALAVPSPAQAPLMYGAVMAFGGHPVPAIQYLRQATSATFDVLHPIRCPLCCACRFLYRNRWNLAEFGGGVILGVSLATASVLTINWLLTNPKHMTDVS